MKIENTEIINLDEIEREARILRAAYTVELFASARAWVVSKFSTPTLVASKAA